MHVFGQLMTEIHDLSSNIISALRTIVYEIELRNDMVVMSKPNVE